MRKTSIMAYGDSGVGKSTQARDLAKYVKDRFNLRTRAIILDTGSGSAHLDDLVEEGIVDVCMVPLAPEYNPYAVMRKFGRGEWPLEGKINAPTKVEEKNAKGEVVRVRYIANTVWKPWAQAETDSIGLIVLDSLTAFASAFMADAKIKNVRAGEAGGADARVEDGEQIGSNTMNHYNDAQNECKMLLNALVSLPVPLVYVTALGDAGTDDSSGTKRPVLGPQTAGKAATGEIPKLVTNCFHLTAEGNGLGRKVMAWYEDHPDTIITSNKWRAKASSVLAEDRMEFVKKYPLGHIPLSLDKGLREFLEFKDRLDEKRAGKGER